MKLKTRLIVAFVIITILPLALTALVVCGFGQYQIKVIEKTYGISGTTYKSFSNPIQVLNRLTEKSFQDLKEITKKSPEKLEDVTYLDEVNEELQKKNAYLLIRKNDIIAYSGADSSHNLDTILPKLPLYDQYDPTSENGIYLGGKVQVLVKQIDFIYPSGKQGSAFIVMDMNDAIPEVQAFLKDILIAVIIILIITAAGLVFWIYQGIKRPLKKMQLATNRIKEGNLDFQVSSCSEDEFGQLCQDFEEMRVRLQENATEKIAYDKESKELISNISHDLKTPLTAIKGYVEGIMDGVADTPEKMDKYIKTIYNKTNEMDLLINELTLYSKIDTNRIPYNFSTLLANEYFDDCAADLSLELESKGVVFSYFNYIEGDPKIIADAEQLKRVINNIITNSLKYMEKKEAHINLHVKDVGDFIQVELEDNGKGIATEDLPNIFDRFYRTDASRNSSKGGSGIGLSIVKKIIEEHGGKIWATSKEGTGTVMHFVVRKYQEVPADE